MSGRSFVDTNVCVYLFDKDAPKKRSTARRLFDEQAKSGGLVLSTQVLKEFYVSVTRKLARPLSPDSALEATRSLGELPVIQVDPDMIYGAIALSHRYGFSFWDSLVLRSALDGGCDRLLTEDLQHGQTIEGLRVENPFQ